jgi:hypothetical protein
MLFHFNPADHLPHRDGKLLIKYRESDLLHLVDRYLPRGLVVKDQVNYLLNVKNDISSLELVLPQPPPGLE